MPRNCNCAGGNCGPQTDGVTRREAITLVGASAATLMSGPAWARWLERQSNSDELKRWKKALHEPAAPRQYTSDKHTDARMHLGGIGTGNIEIGADGQLTTWQLFNTLRDGHVPLYFAVRAGKTAKLLQTTGGPDLPKVARIEMTGEYPIATLRFLDKDLPVRLELEAFSPFSPLDTRLSSMPAAVFVFRIQNPTNEAQTVSLAALMQNPVGYDARGEIKGNEHPNFGGNANQVEWLQEPAGKLDGCRALLMSVAGSREPSLSGRLVVFTNLAAGLNELPLDRPSELTALPLERMAGHVAAPDARTVVWFEDAPADLSPDRLREAKALVEKGATLVFAGRQMPLLQAYGELTGGKPFSGASVPPDIVFEDFENGYGKWKVEGDAFGGEPARGTLANQQPVTGFLGQGLANSYQGGDDTTGKLTSRTFTIERRYIRFLVGGGAHPTTQIRLLVDGKVARATSGRNNERLEPALWDVSDLRSKQAHIEIVDEQKGGWGHINVDQIEFTDIITSPETLKLLDELLPIRFRGIHVTPKGVEFLDRSELADAHSETGPGGHMVVRRPSPGTGSVAVLSGPVLDGAQAELCLPRQNAYGAIAWLAGLTYEHPQSVTPKATGFGTLALGTTGPSPSEMGSFETWREAWDAFAAQGLSGFGSPTGPTAPGRTINGAIASTVTVQPGKAVDVPFFLAWHYPNKYYPGREWMGNHYCALWPDAKAVAAELAANLPAIRERTERFRKTFYEGTLPYWLLDCITSQMATIRHIGVLFRIANGDTYGWEGSNGCCQPTCTHVWGYEQSLSHVFPDLEKDMRRIDFRHQQRADGGINNRTEIPSPAHPTGEQPFSDGHASCILKAYREALNHPNESFFRDYWPAVKRAVEYLVARDAAGSNGQPDGTLNDDQWNTYDEALHGVTTFISGYYLAALRAGEEWAKRVGDPAAAARFRSVFEKGQAKLVDLCWDGEYFRQNLPGYEKMPGEVGPGCMSDQLIGQWWAHQLGLGYILPPEKVVSALKSVFRYNWNPDLTGWHHAPRAFAGAKDKGLIICTWPKGGRPPQVMLYSDEVWTGIEYQVAAHLIYEGLIDEAFAVIKGARDRYDGIPRPPITRNPWNEIECGGHYARAMSSWSILLALSGFRYDGPTAALEVAPAHTPSNFQSFFTGPEGWGRLRQTRRGSSQRDEVKVVEGRFPVSQVTLKPPTTPKSVRVSLGRTTLPATWKPGADGTIVVSLTQPAELKLGQTLVVSMG